MPHSDPQTQKEAQARWFRQKYATDRDFRFDEAARKAAWLETEEGRESNRKASARAYGKAKRARAAALLDEAYKRGVKEQRKKDAQIIAALKAELAAAKAALNPQPD